MENIPKGYVQTKVGILPQDWEVLRVDSVIQRVKSKVEVEDIEEYQQIGIRSHAKGIFHKELVTGEELGNKSVFWIKENCFIVNIVFAWEHAIAKTSEDEKGMIASHRFPMYEPKDNKVDIDYILYFFKSKRGKHLLGLASPGGAGRNKTLGQKEFSELKIPVPPIKEQKKIVEIMITIDSVIKQQEKIIRTKENYKIGLRQKLLKQSKESGDKWSYFKLGELLDYEQPTKYLVANKDYNDNYEIPVLTAGKTFILGYTDEKDGVFNNDLPVIIFDDFTTSSKFVDFPFKAKSSAMKILKQKRNVSIKLIFEIMQMLNHTVSDHKRYWISEYQNLEIKLPPIEKQRQIESVLSCADQEICLLKNTLQEMKEQKKSLMHKLLTGEVRVKV